MINPISQTPQSNFETLTLPQNAEDFYNSPTFAQNTLMILSASIQDMQEAFERSKQEFKDANSLT